MNKLKTGKGALKDYHRCLADEYDDYAEEPEYYDPIPHFTNPDGSQIRTFPNKSKTGKRTAKMTTLWPKFQPDFNLVAASGGIFDRHFGEKLAMYLKVSDIVKLQRTCRYFYKIFIKASIWKYLLSKYYIDKTLSDKVLSSINIMQYVKSMRYSTEDDGWLTREQRKNRHGVVFDTLVIERDMRKEDKYLVRNIIDSLTVKSQKTIDTINKVFLAGTLTENVNMSWMKDLNQVCVWATGYNIHSSKTGAFVSDKLNVFACVVFNKKYEEGVVIQKVYFLNDRYFVIEIEETNEEGERVKNLEVYTIEPENDWFEKKHISLCKQVLKESFVVERGENVKIINIGDFLVFVLEREDKKLSVQVFNEKGDCLFKSEEDLKLEAGLSEVIQSSYVNKSSFSLYLLDEESKVYLLEYSVESGVTLKKIDPLKKIEPAEISKEEENKERQPKQRFPNTMKKYHYGIYRKIDKEYPIKTYEYIMVHKESKFYFMNLKTNELVSCGLTGYNSNSKLFNWTICGEHLYLLIDATIQIYQLDFISSSATLIKKEEITWTFRGSSARWILVNPCMTIVVSASSFDESLMSSLQVFIGSTQGLLIKRAPWDGLGNWSLDQFRLDNILGKVEKWQDVSSLGKETIECKFEDERLLIKTNVRSYFRDFNFCERRVEKKFYEWKNGAIYDLEEPVEEIASSNKPASEGLQQNSTKKNEKSFVTNLAVKENKNHDGKMKKNGNHNWKNVEKKVETEEKLEKKENKKKGDKYYKNVRQGKNRGKMFDS